MKKKMSHRAKVEAMWGLALVAPTIIGLLILNYYPIFETVYQSFCKTGNFGKGNTFIGLGNYIELFHDSEVFSTLFNSVKYAVISLPLTVAISLVLAVLLNRKMRGRTIYRTIYFLPMVCVPFCTIARQKPNHSPVPLRPHSTQNTADILYLCRKIRYISLLLFLRGF